MQNRSVLLKLEPWVLVAAVAVTILTVGGWFMLTSQGNQTNEKKEIFKSGKVWVVKMVTRVSGDKVENVFEPDRLMIAPGDTVRWEVENGLHDTIAFHPGDSDHASDGHSEENEEHGVRPMRIPEEAKPWQSDHLRTPGESFEYTFTVGGVYNYFCHPHQEQGMVGMIIVDRPMPGPGMAPLQEALPEATKAKLNELMEWAKAQKGAR